LDYLQNRKNQTITAPYSVRPKPGATVSTPLDWNEVENITIQDFTIFNIFERIEKKGDIWKKINEKPLNIEKALEQIHDSF
jgi:bifunctional non-homologous end joining protein LigD